MAEYDEGGVDACHEGQGGDEVPEVRHSVMNLDNYYHGMVGYGAVETVMNGLKLKRFKSLLEKLWSNLLFICFRDFQSNT